jgi:hypothetical protein
MGWRVMGGRWPIPRWRRSVIFVVAVTLGVSALAAGAASAQSQKADQGFMVAGPVPQALPSSSLFSTLMADAPMRYQRISVAWDQFATWNGSQCVTPLVTGSEAGVFTGAVAKAEQLGQTPLLLVGPDIWGTTSGYQWPPGAQTGTTPNDQQYKCGVQQLLNTLTAQGLARSGMPIEAFNEPDNSNYYVIPSQAAGYFGDLVAVGGSQIHAIAGVFESPYDDNNPYISQDSTYATDYVSALKASGYNSAATSWAVHDFNDVIASQSCAPNNSSACDHQGLTHFRAWLQSQGEPTSDIWMTEAGDASLGGAWLQHSRSEEAHTAYAWEQLRSYAQHVFWYQWQTFSGDGWDSALLDASGQPRPSYCVLAYGESPSRALSDSRCPGS